MPRIVGLYLGLGRSGGSSATGLLAGSLRAPASSLDGSLAGIRRGSSWPFLGLLVLIQIKYISRLSKMEKTLMFTLTSALSEASAALAAFGGRPRFLGAAASAMLEGE